MRTGQLPRATERRAPSNPECNGSYSFQPKTQSELQQRIRSRTPKQARKKRPPAVRGRAEDRRYRRSVVCARDYRLFYILPGPCTPI
ncbi:unnamed protein product [Brassica rapa]|uniref:Uncharacterized protein n=1 Tax=Brassica campestris TaxID=3711 RepID=A0A8D9G826_BRACM|nr:unnamed protein product [Brassica rapa]